MSEKLTSTHEQSGEKLDLNSEIAKNRERLEEAAEKAEKNQSGDKLESIRQSVEQQAISGKETAPTGHSESGKQTFTNQKALKADAYKKTLGRVRSQLRLPDRVFSKVVHQPVVDSVSNALGSTVARPSGFFGGSLIALIGSGTLLYMARHYGFTYNYAVVFFLFIGGFALGMILELLVRAVFRRKRI